MATAKKQPFDENKNRPGIQGMPVARSGTPAPAGNALLAGQMQRYVDARMELQQAQTDRNLIHTNADQYGSIARLMILKRHREAEAAVKAAAAPAVAPKPKPAAPVKPADPVVAAPTAPTAPTPGMPTAPVAVTDPASQISPEEQNARLRARILLMNAGSRAGRLIQTTNSQLGFRTLSGL
jgi:hypothetical protein